MTNLKSWDISSLSQGQVVTSIDISHDIDKISTISRSVTVAAVAWHLLRSTAKHHNFIKITELICI